MGNGSTKDDAAQYDDDDAAQPDDAAQQDDDTQYTVESARTAAARDDIAAWVARFPASPGSDNPVLSQQLTNELAWWAGPVQLPLHQLQRLAGPPGDPVLCPVDEEYWGERVRAMDKLAERGWDPPPVIVAFRRGEFVLEDGNHRVEGVRRAGRRTIWAVVGFAQREQRDRFLVDWTDSHAADQRGCS
jgi:hypothetical protein